MMETFVIIGVCFLCYELCEFLFQCGRGIRDEGAQSAVFSGPERRRVIYTISERRQIQNAAEAAENHESDV